MLVNEEAQTSLICHPRRVKKKKKLVRENDPFEERGIRLTNIPTGEMYFSSEGRVKKKKEKGRKKSEKLVDHSREPIVNLPW